MQKGFRVVKHFRNNDLWGLYRALSSILNTKCRWCWLVISCSRYWFINIGQIVFQRIREIISWKGPGFVRMTHLAAGPPWWGRRCLWEPTAAQRHEPRWRTALGWSRWCGKTPGPSCPPRKRWRFPRRRAPPAGLLPRSRSGRPGRGRRTLAKCLGWSSMGLWM